jgi:metallophosphoesterase superfamily enzyme
MPAIRVELDPDVHRELKSSCALRGVTIPKLVSDIIKRYLSQTRKVRQSDESK